MTHPTRDTSVYSIRKFDDSALKLLMQVGPFYRSKVRNISALEVQSRLSS